MKEGEARERRERHDGPKASGGAQRSEVGPKVEALPTIDRRATPVASGQGRHS